MNIEKEILTAVLKLTKTGAANPSLVPKTAKVPAKTAEKFLKKLTEDTLIKLEKNILKASSDQRVRIAVQSLKLGADFEDICRFLEWKEFESIATNAFETYGYHVLRNLRFKGENRKRWEIDLIACQLPMIVSVDCKHWRHNWTRAPIMAIVEQHVERTKALANSLPSLYTILKLDKWSQAKIVPVILSLLPSPFKLHDNTPIVPVLQLQSFLNELPAHMDFLTHFSKKATKIDRELTEY